ncbi:hypothetical protein [Polymorphospora sp. NPDC050346]|uniref:hypothetical protein n=1 Tax=Polymorphospora sp. NPDC050346 TaxID=3155780 RepID=UPI0033CD77D2
MTLTVQVTGQTAAGRRWELIDQKTSYAGQPLYLIRLDGQESWAGPDIAREIRMQVDPEWAARQREIARKQAEEQAAAERARQANERRRSECERDGRRVFVRYGFARSGYRSVNRRDDRLEAGLSVYPAWIMPDGAVVLDMRGIDFVSFLFGAFRERQMYVAMGRPTPVGTGSDGEPLLGRFALKKINDDNTEYVY